jgi:hypothetical protein
MNKGRILKLETKVEGDLNRSKGTPHIWRPEKGKLAIVASSFIINKLKSLNREIIYSPYIFKAVYVDREDRDIVDRIEGRNLYLKGLKKPVFGMPEIIWVKTGNNEQE